MLAPERRLQASTFPHRTMHSTPLYGNCSPRLAVLERIIFQAAASATNRQLNGFPEGLLPLFVEPRQGLRRALHWRAKLSCIVTFCCAAIAWRRRTLGCGPARLRGAVSLSTSQECT